MSRKKRKVNVYNKNKRRIVCVANKYDCLDNGTTIYEKELQVGKQYTFVKAEINSRGSLVYLEESMCKKGYHVCLFEEIQPYDVRILEREYKNIESNSQGSVLAKLKLNEKICKEMYENQNDLEGQKRKSEKSVER